MVYRNILANLEHCLRIEEVVPEFESCSVSNSDKLM
jgi:hypothetical protein